MVLWNQRKGHQRNFLYCIFGQLYHSEHVPRGEPWSKDGLRRAAEKWYHANYHNDDDDDLNNDDDDRGWGRWEKCYFRAASYAAWGRDCQYLQVHWDKLRAFTILSELASWIEQFANLCKREQIRKTCGNMGTYGNFGREQGNMEPLGRHSVMPNMVRHNFIAGFGQRQFSVQQN